jgi:hypothetical protein
MDRMSDGGLGCKRAEHLLAKPTSYLQMVEDCVAECVVSCGDLGGLEAEAYCG